MQSNEAWYVYGVIGAPRDGAEVASLQGVDPRHRTEVFAEGPVAALVSRVPGEDFDEDGLRAHLADLEWVERLARAHERVIEKLAGETTLVPMRMCTVYRGEDSVRALLRREEQALMEALGQLAGKSEWGVKVFIDPRAAASGGEQPSQVGGSDAAPSGAAYLARRRHERDRRERAHAEIDELATEIFESLRAVAADGLVNAPQRPEVSGHSGQMVLNGAYLVDEGEAAAFHQTVDALQARVAQAGIELVRTGPWPPYNFVPGSIGVAP